MLKLAANSPKNMALMRWVTPIIALAVAFVLGAILLLVLGQNPLAVYNVFFIEPFSSAYSVAEVINKSCTLAIIALGLSVCFRSNIWNIGAEGQFTIGAIAATAVAVKMPDLPGLLLWMMVAAAVGGALWGAIPAFLRVRFGVNEILVSLMLVYIALLLLSYVVYGPLKDPKGYGFPHSPLFADNALLPIMVEKTRLYASFLLLPLVFIGIVFLLKHTLLGFQMHIVGLEPTAARYAGYSATLPVWICFMLSGALAGLMGMVEVAGPIGQLTEIISPGYGFTAIIVAFLGRLSPFAIILAAVLMALVYIGGETVQITMQLPPSISLVFQGLILFCLLASDFLINYRVKWQGGGEQQ